MGEYENYLQELRKLPVEKKKLEARNINRLEDTAYTKALDIYEDEHKELGSFSFEERMKIGQEIYNEVKQALS